MNRCLRAAALATALATGFALSACGGGSGPSAMSTLVVQLTDNHTDALDAVNVYFTSVTVKPVGEPPQTLALTLSPNPQDLLVLQDAVTTLATGVVTPGEYEFIMINLDEDQSNVVEAGVPQPLRIPSEEIKILGGLSVEEGGTTTVTLDFDAEASLNRLGNGQWLMTPIIVMADP